MSANTSLALTAIGWIMTAVTLTAAEPWPAVDQLPSQKGLPDPTVTLRGKKVDSKEIWESQRKPELKTLFEHYMYGALPETPKGVTGHLLYENTRALGGRVHLREIELRFDVYGQINPTPIRMLLATPPGDGPFPCFVGLMFCGNHALAPDRGIRLPDNWQYDRQPGVVKNRATDEGRGKQMQTWPIETICARGYALAAFYSGDIQPDRPQVNEGLRKVLPKGSDTATVMSWAWGAHRVVDYLVTEKTIDPKRIAVVGHSRLGKAALVAGAFDPRFAVVIPNQAGCGGSGPSRHNDPKAESIKRINTSFPHWFCGNFKLFNDDPTKLPFDQNGLVALCSPRPVLFTNATEDLWANPSGQFAVLKAAEPAYSLAGVDGCSANAMPNPGELVDSRLGYWIRPGEHAMTPLDWEVYLRYADKWLKR